MSSTEEYFYQFRKNIVGINQSFISPYGEKKIIYADWIASGRLYIEIENKMLEQFGPYVGNTHSEASITGTTMTHAYHHARDIIKSHVNASKDDVIITAGSGMTGVINKLQRILGLRVPEQLKDFTNLPAELRPVVFLTHMEHHSNQTSWLETIADVIVLDPDQLGLVNPITLQNQLSKYSDRKLKIGSFTSCSNVTGIRTPYHELAKIMHKNGGYCFIDFACSAPYDIINMHPQDPEEKLDAIFFSPHKFLGGPATPGVLIFDSNLYHNQVPDNPGGGTVDWTNPWGRHKFVNNIEAREDGGTPQFLQTIKAALAIQLKNKMSSEKIVEREEELIEIVFDELEKIPSLHILAGHIKQRLGAISFYVDGIHYNLIVKILNDRFGIQVRGGCSCAGTYGHFLLHVDQNYSNEITEKINHGDLSKKPGWVRLSLHPTMTNSEIHFICSAIKQTVDNIIEWQLDYNYDIHTNEFFHKNSENQDYQNIDKWFFI
jgi:selenocysteine lyase/cysteine desulfurase